MPSYFLKKDIGMDQDRTILDGNENTILDNRLRTAGNGQPGQSGQPGQRIIRTEVPMQAVEQKKESNAELVVVGGISAVMLGGTALLFSSFAKDGEDAPDAPAQKHETEAPYLVDDDLHVAHGTRDDMSFGQAFASARAEVGPGGVFEWRGNVYSTYVAEEWNAMTPAEKAEYQSNFTWTHGQTADLHDYDMAHHRYTDEPEHDQADNKKNQSEDKPEDNRDDMADNKGIGAHDSHDSHDSHYADTDYSVEDDAPVVDVQPDEAQVISSHSGSGDEIEVLGVEHDADHCINVGVVSVDDTEVALIDINNDEEFELLAHDTDNDGEYQDSELTNISDQHITVDDLGGFTDGYDGCNDLKNPDYINDGLVDF